MLLDIKIKFSNRTIDKKLDYPDQTKIEVEFNQVSEEIVVESITINDIDANIYYNTCYKFFESKVPQKSVHTIDQPGIYTLTIDDLYIRSLRSSTWHCSEKARDFIHAYEFTRSSFVENYRDRNHKGFDNDFIPCFGCSFTYGAGQPDTVSWPYLLAKKTGKNFLNPGMLSAGTDAIYNNMSLLHECNPFDKCVILIPPFARRIVQSKIGDLYIKICSNVDLNSQKSNFHFFNDPGLREQMDLIKQKIIEDVDNKYSILYVDKILNFCKEKKINLYCSAWHEEEYKYLKQKQGFTLLPAFPKMDSFKERATDGRHPHEKHYRLFVDQITTTSNFP